MIFSAVGQGRSLMSAIANILILIQLLLAGFLLLFTALI